MPESAVISRPALSDDGAGGRETVFVQVASGVKCRFESVELVDVQNISALGLTGSETARIALRKTWRICFPWGTNVARDDLVVVSGATYKVMDTFDKLSHEPHLTTLVMQQ
jgi:hypothetical protein